MKAIKILILFFVLLSTGMYAQRGRGHRRGPAVVVVRSTYRPAVVGVYHPVWHPNYAYHRRWVYFPRQRVYYDNWRNHYVYYDNNVWVSQPTAPAFLVNIDLSKEKHRELREDYDDDDEVYKR